MKTNVEIDEALLSEAKKLSQAKTKKQVVEQALQHYIQSLYRKQMLELRGKVQWEGDLDQMRSI
ncbi:MAG: type II toxin-antitoxin system VapB family antitoxin [Cytophagales bacterium]|nr:type II toxin-antitoxin system VapB family antitoxin [Cytophagales bacterium]